jgi:UDP-N-acetylglucosamine transferase subunit ALG13
MILVTVGTQLPFDRLIRHIDEIAPSLGQPVLAQIGKGSYRPVNCEYREDFEPHVFDATFRKADVVVSHAGIGTVLTAQRLGKPIILFARRAAFGEHRNDHQVASCAQLAGRPGIAVAETTGEITAMLDRGRLAAASDAELVHKRAQFCRSLSEALARL